MPTLKAAGSLSVGERDRRFGPAIRSAFDIGTMTRLASGPAWSKFSGAQQAAVRDAFARFLVAEYAHQVSDYSGESFVVDPQTSPSSGGGEVVKTKLLQPGGRTVQINYLVRGGRIIDVYLNGTISDLATRRDEFAIDPLRRRRRGRSRQDVARTDRKLVGGLAARLAVVRKRPGRLRTEARGGDHERPWRTALCGDAQTLRARLAEAARPQAVARNQLGPVRRS